MVLPAHEPPPLPPFGHPLPLGGGEGKGEGAVGWFKRARRAQSSECSLLGERVRVGRSSKQNEDAELKKRKKVWKAPKPRCTRGVLAKYANAVTSASLGAATDMDLEL